ncbi:uncharacterized protein LY89DRAFT_198681 [Mollisia scopiformis]|uniref:Uncharacterized protein n=1 Tax=Mollisia scopiformis TaxID=149040 RepID=A0A194WYH7_MOLSC|nr:uncharacterized protein LY89DRAFT_198681 [Mollisia scopiformis]KUJ13021.1 hypothetical protein LY89DRAFT_198681 [Mollisia scopiformis]
MGRFGPPHKVPTEIVMNIIIYTRYEDLQALCDATGRLTFEEAKYHRYDPRRYLRTLTPYPDVLLGGMRDTNTILSGSRAAAFFYQMACRWDSDWDFYCSGGDVAVARFTHLLFTRLGVTWDKSEVDVGQHIPLDDWSTIYEGDFHILHGNLSGHKLQVMWYRDDQNRHSVFNMILEFHSSIVQCFISGWCAASLYHKISGQDKMVAWEIDGVLHPRKRAKAPQCVSKYQYRGFQLVHYSRQLVGLASTEPDFLSLDAACLPRSVSDKACLLIDFDVYSRPSLTSSKLVSAMHLAAMEEIMNLRWGENTDASLKFTSLKLTSTMSEKFGMYRLLRSLEEEYMVEHTRWKPSEDRLGHTDIYLRTQTICAVPWMPPVDVFIAPAKSYGSETLFERKCYPPI